MKRNDRFSFLRLGGSRRAAGAEADAGRVARGLKGADLEQAYRELLLENQVLVESNQRLHERIARQESGLEESPAARRLIRTQRHALAERSHKLREVAYEFQLLQREHAKLSKENARLARALTQHSDKHQSLSDDLRSLRAALDESRSELRAKKNELARLTDRYYQLEAQQELGLRPGTAANGEF